MSATGPVLELSGISKHFGGVNALADVDFVLDGGQVHGLVGENGAGKSTLMKIIAGVHTDFEGTMRLDGVEVRFRSAHDARAAGIGMVYQELSVVRDLSVAENVFLGRQPTGTLGLIAWRHMMREAGDHLRGLGIDVDPQARMGALPVGLQQLVELSRVLFSGARVIILDEPTSALSPPEIDRLFGLLRKLRDDGRTIVFISHFLDDVLRVSDTVTIFRNGRKVATGAAANIEKRWIIERMIGAGNDALEAGYTQDIRLEGRDDTQIVLEVDQLSFGRAYRGVSLNVRAGEVLGLYGFMGCGQLELVRTLFGGLKPDHGTIRLEGNPVRMSNTAAARRAGIAFVPESRRSMLFLLEPMYKNVSISILERLSRFLLKPSREREIAAEQGRRLRIVPASVERRVGTFSGGNQQKIALAKWLNFLPKVLILSEPTRGMDVGAKADVVRIVQGLRDEGVAILVASTEPETVLAMADRVLVMKKGEIVHEFADEVISKDRLLAAA
ncbi:MAG: sugar ABC transporter ATP-binding protein [Verrucomicrobia bacterium]|nr:sugar ABC transporter ATP-binding protein [Verrucomicrobiota bacterium]MBV8277476.1 sugar ABC transporter ATP-binding protein [Verrucomicrobiota bacterium]